MGIVIEKQCKECLSSSHLSVYISVHPPPTLHDSSYTERAYEAGQGHEALPEDERENSIFVSAIKKHFNSGRIKESIEVVLAEAARGE